MSWKDDRTLDPSLESWVLVPPGSDFPVQNLPFGQVDRGDHQLAAAVRIGDHVLDLRGAASAGLLDGATDLRQIPLLHSLLFLERAELRAIRERVSELLTDESHRPAVEPHLLHVDEVHPLLPAQTRDYVDFYSSLEHATNMGRMFRPDQDPLLPNWRWMPIGYHGRAGTLVASGAAIRRPRGQIQQGDEPPTYAPTRALDIELEMGFLTSGSNPAGEPIPIGEVRDHMFGMVIVNDWSARDIQRWEYQPLGPFLGKSFATSVSPWVVTFDALEPYRVAAPRQDPSPLPHLRSRDDWAFDVTLEVALQGSGTDELVISRTSFAGMYWTVAQQLAHATSNGATAKPGDLFASGTISGSERGTEGSLIELTRRGEEPIELPDGSSRTFLEDGDTVILRAWCEGAGKPRIGFGECRGTILPA
ncbi:MAG TPA: fumarylacetoacetase [Actinomycetota bacterium]|nr:fumarylacetoacetase [Actinomycetota bacterium]